MVNNNSSNGDVVVVDGDVDDEIFRRRILGREKKLFEQTSDISVALAETSDTDERKKSSEMKTKKNFA